MKTRYDLRISTIVLFALVMISFAMIPVKVFAEVTLTQSDFTEAKQNPGTSTSKGISYIKDEEIGDYYSFEPGTYTLAEDITVEDDIIMIDNNGEYIFDLNGKSLIRTGDPSGFFYFVNGKLKITGNGKIENDPSIMTLIDCEAEIDNGTLSGAMTCSTDKGHSSLTINDANVDGPIWLTGENATGVINNGTFYDRLNAAFMVSDGASLTVNDGTFTSGETGLAANGITNTSADGKPAKSLVINGGTFKVALDAQDPDVPPIGAVCLEKCDEVILNGGTFIAEGDALGAIVATVNKGTPDEEFQNFLGTGYSYSDKLQLKKTGTEGFYATQNNISVVAESKQTNPLLWILQKIKNLFT